MTHTFHGVERVLEYSLPGVRENSCVAVDLAMLGVGSYDEVDKVLRETGLTRDDGQTEFTGMGDELSVNGNEVLIEHTGFYIPKPGEDVVDDLLHDARDKHERAIPSLIPVMLDEGNPSRGLHFVLLAGEYREDGETTEYVVGDSLKDGIQITPIEVFVARLQRTLHGTGVLFTYDVVVDYA